MDFIDLKAQQARIRQRLEENIRRVLDHGRYIQGPEVREFEEKVAAYVGVKHAIGCASGTDALLMALMAYGVGPGDAVFTTPFTFIATAEVVSLLGATPVFVDIDPRTFNIDPKVLKVAVEAVEAGDPGIYPLPKSAKALSPRGVIAVDLFGQPADYEPIRALAREKGLFLIEDGAQSLGGEYKGKRACALGDIGCTSFFPAKPLGCYGDGGMCFTDDDSLAETLRSIRVHGQGQHKYDNVRIGINGRLDTLQAAILLAKFEIFPEEVALRQVVAERYSQLLAEVPRTKGIPAEVQPPFVAPGCKSVWAQYSLLAESSEARQDLVNKLKAAGVPTAVYYPKPLHLQEAFAPLGYGSGQFPVSEDAAARIFSIPMHPYLSAEAQERVVAAMLG